MLFACNVSHNVWVTALNNMKHCSDIQLRTFLTYILNFNNWLFIIIIIDGGIALEVSKLKIPLGVVLFFNSHLVFLGYSCQVPLALNDSHTCMCVGRIPIIVQARPVFVYINLPVGGALNVLSCGFINKAVSKLNYFFIWGRYYLKSILKNCTI